MGTGELNAGVNPMMDWHPIQGEVEFLLVASCYRNRVKPRPDGSLGSYADFTLPTHFSFITLQVQYQPLKLEMRYSIILNLS